MTTTDDPSTLDPATLSDLDWSLAPPGCQCRHRQPDGPDSGCGDVATHQVTLVCRAEGCDCAASVYLLCGECVRVWCRRARSDPAAPELRITPL